MHDAATSLVAVHAHPDDETLATGGLLAAWSAQAPTAVVTCTRGERGEVIPPELAHLQGDGAAMAAVRERELAAALDALGVRSHTYLDRLAGGGSRFEDSGMAWAGPGRAVAVPDAGEAAFTRVAVDDAAAPLAAWLRRVRPLAVVTYDPSGGYGHPDHVHAHLVTMRAVDMAADTGTDGGAAPWRVPYLLWAVPRGVVAPAVASLPWVTVAVDVAAVAGALHAHRTQVQRVLAVDGDGGSGRAGSADAGADDRDPVAGHPVLGYALSNGVPAFVRSREIYAVVDGDLAAMGGRLPVPVHRVP